LTSLSVAEEPADLWLSPGARHIALAGGSDDVLLRDLEGAAPARPLKLWSDRARTMESQYAADFSPDGQRLAIIGWRRPGGSSPLTIRDVATGTVLATCPVEIRQTSKLAFGEGGRSLLINGNAELTRWIIPVVPDRGTGPLWLAGHQDEGWSLAFDPTGRLLLTGSDDTDEPQTLKTWDQSTGRLVGGCKPQAGTIAALAFSPDGHWLATGSLTDSRSLCLWDATPLSRGRPVNLEAELDGPDGYVRTVAFSPDGRRLAASGDDHIVRIWDVPTCRLLYNLQGHSSKVRDLAFSPDGRRLASASNDCMIRIWSLGDGLCERILMRPSELADVAFTPDGTTLAGAEQRGVVTLWDVETGRVKLSLPVDDRELRCMAISPDGQALAVSGSTGRIHLFDELTGQELLSLDGHAAPVNKLSFSPDGATLASCSHDGAVALWRTNAP
jgi:WD40 repeat protein